MTSKEVDKLIFDTEEIIRAAKGSGGCKVKKQFAEIKTERDELKEVLKEIETFLSYEVHLNEALRDEGAFNEEPPTWAQDSFNDNEAYRCGYCWSWTTVVRPGKTQCDFCGDDYKASLLLKIRSILSEEKNES